MPSTAAMDVIFRLKNLEPASKFPIVDCTTPTISASSDSDSCFCLRDQIRRSASVFIIQMEYINLFFGVGLYKHMCNDSWYGNAKNRARTTFYWVNPKEISRSRTLFSVAHLSPSRRT